MSLRRHTHKNANSGRGFSLIEVLVAILVLSIGLLGLSKMEALAISNTQVASSRSLIALQASSLAAAMNGNKAYWAAGVAPTSFSAQGTVVTDSLTGVLNQTTPNCATAAAPACTPAQLAAYDLRTWAANMTLLVPAYTATFTCTNVAGSQITCVITINWPEKYVALNRTTATGSAASGGTQTSTQSYSLYVAP
jgi:type IV pilus assembly protein PilV